MKRFLFVDDEPRVLDGLQRVLRPHRLRWDCSFAAGGAAGLAEFEREPFDIVVTDMRMPGMDGAAFLEVVAARWPATVRLVLSGQADADAAMRAAGVAHQFLSKPCEPAVLERVLARADALHGLISAPHLASLLGGVDRLPGLPRIHRQLSAILNNPDAGVGDVARVVEQDAALAAKVLQLVNSSFFGHTREVVSVERAVSMLGTRLIHSLTAAHGVFRAVEQAVLPPWFDAEAEQRHATMVAALARRLVPDPALMEGAFAAGLLHDVGRLLLALRAGDAVTEARAVALRDGIPLVAAERQVLGTTHAEVGAYLLGIWGLPWQIVGAVRWHHTPADAADAELAVYVHAADALLHEVEVQCGREGQPPRLDDAFLSRTGLSEHLAAWRAMAAELATEGPSAGPAQRDRIAV